MPHATPMQLSLAGQIHNLAPFSIMRRCLCQALIEGFKDLTYEIKLGHASLISMTLN